MDLRTDYEDDVDEIDASWFNDVGLAVNENTAARAKKGLFSALPAAGAAGRLYFSTDTGTILRDNGTSWDVVGRCDVAHILPPASSWSTNTLGTATVTADKDGRLFTIPSSGGLLTPRIEYRTLSPTSNYTVTARIEPADFARSEGQSYSGLILRHGSSSNTIIFGYMVYAGQVNNLIVTQGNSGNLIGSHYTYAPVDRFPGFPRWLRVRDDATNRYYEFSINGIDWVEFYSGSRTNYITPDQVGWGGSQSTSLTRSLVVRLRSFNVS
ncbi:hypothetical protein CONSTELLA_36 [Mycobacterium phage Constella]|nr:hypothetical protein CONSTELLA_36 [Mycobacterium phage Constella]